MKKYLSGLFALVLAIGLSAYNKSEEEKWPFEYKVIGEAGEYYLVVDWMPWHECPGEQKVPCRISSVVNAQDGTLYKYEGVLVLQWMPSY